MKKIPLRKRDGGIVGTIVAWAMVDDEDYEWALQWTWRLGDKGYARRGMRINGKFKNIYLHNEIAKRAGLDTSRTIDHENQDQLDNRRSNLRPATRSQQNRNRGKQSNNTSGFVGVSRKRKKWLAHITLDGKQLHLGIFATPVEAAMQRNIYAMLLHDNFASNLIGTEVPFTRSI